MPRLARATEGGGDKLPLILLLSLWSGYAHFGQPPAPYLLQAQQGSGVQGASASLLPLLHRAAPAWDTLSPPCSAAAFSLALVLVAVRTLPRAGSV